MVPQVDTREIEIKLALSRMEIERLVRLFDNQGNQTIRDEYFDSSDFHLTRNNIWLRHRSDSKGACFEAKVGTRSNSSVSSGVTDYEEIRDINRIALLLQIPPDSVSPAGLKEAGYQVFCSCVTSRSKWKSGIFTLDIDDSSFVGYPEFSFPVAELEVAVDDPQKAEELARQLFKERAVEFRTLPFGKILEFLRVNRLGHFLALVEAKIINMDQDEYLNLLIKNEAEEPGEHGMVL